MVIYIGQGMGMDEVFLQLTKALDCGILEQVMEVSPIVA